MIDVECPECRYLGPNRVTDDDDPHLNVSCVMCGFTFTVRTDGRTE